MDRSDLIELASSGEHLEFVFFWGHEPAHGVGKQCLSQWYEAPFVIDEVTYPTAEHFMMAEKARLFEDEPSLRSILAAETPRGAKSLGRRVRNFDEAKWVAHRFDAVVRGNVGKFEQHDALRGYLLGTDDRILVEASPLDRIWGIGLDEHSPDAPHPDRWRGDNLLGFALMEVRQRLRAAL